MPYNGPPLTVPATFKGRPLANPFAGGRQTITLNTVSDLAAVIYQSAIPDAKRGPYAIIPAKLHTKRGEEDVYIVSLNGVNKDWVKEYGQAMGAETARLAGVNEDNSYFDAVRSRMLSFKDIPEGSKVIFAGHSLGGMVAQQLAADSQITGRFEVRNTIAMGSPEIGNNKQEGQVRRLVDANDPITSASGESAAKGAYGIKDPRQVNRDSKMAAGLGWDAHSRSYLQPKVWAGVNVLGEESYGQGPVSITFDRGDMNFKTAPAPNGTRKFTEASYSTEASSEGSAAAGEKVRAALAMILKSDAGVPDASTLGGTRPEQLAAIHEVLSARGMPALTPEHSVAVLALANTLGPEHLTASEPQQAAAGLESGPTLLAAAGRPAPETGLSI